MKEKLFNILGTKVFFWIMIILFVSLSQNKGRVWENWSDDAILNYMIFETVIAILFLISSGLRAKQIGKSGWLWVTMIIPIVNLYFIYILGIKKFTKRAKLKK